MTFSVIIPSYNRAQFIGKTIVSVLTQTYPDFELIIVDDGSTDHTHQVVQQFTDRRIRYFRKENGERGAARNFGVEKATADYITFLDSDDLIKADHLQTASYYIQREQPLVFHLGYDVVNASGKILYGWRSLPSPVNKKLAEGNFLSCLGVFLKRGIALDHLFNESRALAGSEDYELWLRLAARYPVVCFPDVTAMLVHHENRSVLQPDGNKLIIRIEMLRKLILKDEMILKYYAGQLQSLNSYLDIYLALHLSLVPRWKAAALKYLIKAVSQYPFIITKKRFWAVVRKLIIKN